MGPRRGIRIFLGHIGVAREPNQCTPKSLSSSKVQAENFFSSIFYFTLDTVVYNPVNSRVSCLKHFITTPSTRVSACLHHCLVSSLSCPPPPHYGNFLLKSTSQFLLSLASPLLCFLYILHMRKVILCLSLFWLTLL